MDQYKEQEYEAVNFDGRDLRYGDLFRCTFKKCTFINALMEEITTSSCRFIECNFKGASLNASVHTETAFENCNFNEANLYVSKFTACKMTGSDFSGAQMDGISLLQGDWSYTNLRHTKLTKQDLRGVRFYEADLSDANLEKADLRDCDLTRVTLSRAKLKGADLRGANLEGIDLKTLDVKGTRMDSLQAIMFLRSYGARID
jgi:fluoroquinolone resistance protein